MNKNGEHKNFSILKEPAKNKGEQAKCPAFVSSKASVDDKKQQWNYYFAKHAEEVKAILEGKAAVLCVDALWLKEEMPNFEACMMISVGSKRSYTNIGNTTLREQPFKEHVLSLDAYIRYKGNLEIDEIAKKAREDELKSGTALLLSPEPFVSINQDLDKRICKDNILKNVVFLVGMSAYGQNPLNLFLEGPSSTGKTYVVTQTLRLFPKEDIWYLGGMSPTALVHDRGEKEEIDGETFKIIDLSEKILVFLEKPNKQTLEKLLPILSHDTDEIEYRITDKNAKGQHTTLKALIRGYPAVIFCTTKSETLKDLSTRNMLYAPEITGAKIKEVVDLQMKEATEPWELQTERNDIQVQVQKAIRVIRNDFRGAEVVIPAIESVNVETGNDPRIMRDNKKRLELIKSCTRLHILQRLCLEYNKDGEEHKIIVASFLDVLIGLYLYDEIAVSTTTGLAPVVVKFFNDILKPFKSEGPCNYKDMQKRHNEHYKQVIGVDAIRKSRIDPLEQAGYVTASSEEKDKRFVYFSVAQDIPAPETSGKKRIFEIGDANELEKGKSWVNKIVNIPDVKLVMYRGLYSTINLSDFSRDTSKIRNYLYDPHSIRYFLTLFPQLDKPTDEEIGSIFKNPLNSDIFGTEPTENESSEDEQTQININERSTEGGEGCEGQSPLNSGTLKDQDAEAIDEPRTSGEERGEISHGEDVEVVSMRGKQ